MVVNLTDMVSDPLGMARLSDELTEICAEIAWDEEVRVVVFTGSGDKSFSLGAGVNRTVSGIGEAQEIKFFSIAEPIAKIDRPSLQRSGRCLRTRFRDGLGLRFKNRRRDISLRAVRNQGGFDSLEWGNPEVGTACGRGKPWR